jgi:hypothetical protein
MHRGGSIGLVKMGRLEGWIRQRKEVRIIGDMTTIHLNNAIKYLERMYQERHKEYWKHYLPNIYYNMVAECTKRKGGK